MIYRPSWINAFESAVLAARGAEQLRRGCVARVEGGHQLVVTAQLEVIAGKVVSAAEGTVQDLPKAIGPTESPAALRDQEPAVRRGRLVALIADITEQKSDYLLLSGERQKATQCMRDFRILQRAAQTLGH